MGYTHYWTHKNNVDTKEYSKKLRDIKTIVFTIASKNCELLNDPVLAGGFGTGKPKIQSGACFNGIDENSHETFSLPQHAADLNGFDFCKTAYKPYDIVVVACLAVLAEVPGITVSSDGDSSDWIAGIDLVSNILGREVKNPIQ